MSWVSSGRAIQTLLITLCALLVAGQSSTFALTREDSSSIYQGVFSCGTRCKYSATIAVRDSHNSTTSTVDILTDMKLGVYVQDEPVRFKTSRSSLQIKRKSVCRGEFCFLRLYLEGPLPSLVNEEVAVTAFGERTGKLYASTTVVFNAVENRSTFICAGYFSISKPQRMSNFQLPSNLSLGHATAKSTIAPLPSLGDLTRDPQKECRRCGFQRDSFSFLISERVEVGTIIGRLDVGLKPNCPMDYGLNPEFDLGEDRTFDVRSDGVIIARSRLVSGRSYTFSIRLTCQDGRQWVAPVQVQQLLVNQFAPKFLLPSYEFRLAGPYRTGQSLGSITATDPDAGERGQLAYVLVDNGSLPIIVDRVSGELRTISEIDSDLLQRKNFQLLVRAMDSGWPWRLETEVEVFLRVDSVSGSRTQFPSQRTTREKVGIAFKKTTYDISVSEDVPPGYVVVTVAAELDTSSVCSRVIYLCKNGCESGVFRVDAVAGDVRAVLPLDYESQPQHTLTVQAWLVLDASVRSEATVSVTVVDVNEHPPRFERSLYVMDLSESAALGHEVGRVVANDADRDGVSVSYEFLQSGGCPFEIDRGTGVIRVRRPLDREKVASYTLHVVARDNPPNHRYSVAVVIVNITDVNDNSPEFLRTGVVLYVESCAPRGAVIGGLFARDPDEASNGSVIYYWSQGSVLFHLDEHSGWVSVNTDSLPANTLIQLVAEASDRGSPPRSSVVDVTIVIGRELRRPVLTQTLPIEYTLPSSNSVLDYINHSFGDLLSLRLTDGSCLGSVLLNRSTGVLSRMPGSLHMPSVCWVTISSYHKLDSSLNVNLHLVVVDRNGVDYVRFSTPFSIINFSRGIPKGTPVFRPSVTSSCSSSSLRYTLGRPDDRFSMDPFNGTVTTNRLILVEEPSVYNLQLCASCNQVSSCTVVSVVTDIAGTVSTTSSSLTVLRNGCYEMHVGRSDKAASALLPLDAAFGDKMDFSVLPGQPEVPVYISTSKLLMLKEPSSSWTQSYYHVILAAASVETTALPLEHLPLVCLRIVSADVARISPKFVDSMDDVNVYGSVEIGQAVYRPSIATSDVISSNSLLFKVRSATVEGVFYVHPKTGVVEVAADLRPLSGTTLTLVLEACDPVIPAASTTMSLTVHVQTLHVVEERPVFDPAVCTGSVLEGVPIGTPIVQCSTRAAQALFSLLHVPGDCMELFQVDQFSGMIMTKGDIDAELLSECSLTLIAQGISQLRDTTNVKISVIDANDHAPMFPTALYVGFVVENAPIGSCILEAPSLYGNTAPLAVQAQDMDSGLNQVVTYSILSSGASVNLSHSRTTGYLCLLQAIDFETTPEINFTLLAFDGGEPPLMSMVAVSVRVINVNDNPPRFAESLARVMLYAPLYVGMCVYKAEASDPDSTVSYSLANADAVPFFVNSSSGLVCVGDLGSPRHEYELRITASDPNFHTEQTLMVTVLPPIDQGLRLVPSVNVAKVMENVADIQYVVDMDAMGYPLDSCIRYRLLVGQPQFSIDTITGRLSSTNGTVFDRESKETYLIVAEAQDNRSPPRMARYTLYVTVEDANDNAPVFANTSYYCSVNASEDMVGSLVLAAPARDLDRGLNSTLRYWLSGESSHWFRVDQHGSVYLMKRMEPSEFTITLHAGDMGSPSLTGSVPVTVSVFSHLAPLLSRMSYNLSVPEDVPVGHVVTTLEAEVHTGKLYLYSITSGNELQMFHIDFLSGQLFTVTSLDFEEFQLFQLSITVIDALTGVSVLVKCTIHVTDVNDNRPVTKIPFFSFYTRINLRVGEVLGTVAATDADSGHNAQLTYIMQKSEGGYFDINNVTGRITLKRKLDSRAVGRHFAIVMVTDNGLPALSTSVLVEVVVFSRNRNPPVLIEKQLSISIEQPFKNGTVIGVIRCTDVDSSSLRYSITASPIFAVDPQTGIVHVTSAPAQVETYTLTVECSDGELRDTGTWHVSLKNTGYHPLVVLGTKSTLQVDEGNTGYLFPVMAVDPLNSELNCSIDSAKLAKEFQFLEGRVSALQPVRRPRWPGTIQLPLRITNRFGYFILHRVTLISRHPKNLALGFSLRSYENVTSKIEDVGSFVLTLKASPLDPTFQGIDIVYSLSNTNQFIVDRSTGVITVSQPLTPGTYRFSAHAGIPGVAPSASVGVVVRVVNAKQLRIERPVYTVLLKVNTTYLTPVLYVSVQEVVPDLQYDVLQGLTRDSNADGTFGMSAHGGLVLTRRLRTDDPQRFFLTVKASSNSSKGMKDYATIVVLVVNDARVPLHFHSSVYNIVVSELQPVNTELVTVTAETSAGLPGFVRYRLLQWSDTRPSVELDSTSGRLYLTKPLDRTRGRDLVGVVEAHDSLTNERVLAQVVLSIVDSNNNPPYFEKEMFYANIRENTPKGITVHEFRASDVDTEGSLQYFLVQGDPQGKFLLSADGVLTVNRDIDREETSSFTLAVVVSDGVHSARTSLVVSVLDENDNSPLCQVLVYNVKIPENFEVDRSVVHISVHDQDTSDSLTFTIVNDASGKFFIFQNGTVVLTAPLDREASPYHSLRVMAKDMAGHTCYSDTYIDLVDVNDNPPRFLTDLHQAVVKRDMVTGTWVTQVIAEDPDYGQNRLLKYSMTDPTGQFTIDAWSGVVTLTRPIMRSTEKVTLEVIATNPGAFPLSSRTPLVVLVMDGDEGSPQFSEQAYHFTVAEDTSPGLSIGSVSTVLGYSASARYSIISPSSHLPFRVSEVSGKLKCTDLLDFERARSYQFIVRATLTLSHLLYAEAPVTVRVLDVNDNTPVFIRKSYQTEIDENAQRGTFVLQVNATDSDSGLNGEVVFSILWTDLRMPVFAVHPSSGIISVTGPIDYESQRKYVLVIQAQDRGSSPLSSSVNVTIIVVDLNDNAPSFLQDHYVFVVFTKRRPTGFKLGCVSAIDIDGPGNSLPLRYSLQSSAGCCTINSLSGEVSYAPKESLVGSSAFAMTVRVEDSGTPSLSGVAKIDVLVKADSLHPPELLTNSVFSVVLSGLDEADLFQIVARDRDDDPRLIYNTTLVASPQQGGLLKTHLLTGVVRGLLIPGVHRILLAVSDGLYSSSKEVPLTVHLLTPAMLTSSAVVRLRAVTRETFVSNYMQAFKELLAGLLRVHTDHVTVWGVMDAAQAGDIQVAFAAIVAYPEEYVAPERLLRVISQIRDVSGLEPVLDYKEVCSRVRCSARQQCGAGVGLTGSWDTISGDLTLRLPAFELRPSCTEGLGCGFAPCERFPCAPGERCIVNSSSCQPRCECSEPGSCQILQEDLLFKRNGFVQYVLWDSVDQPSKSVSVRIRTEQPDGVLFYAPGIKDYAILEVEAGFVVFRFDFGSGMGMVRVSDVRIDDGLWHDVVVKRVQNEATLTIDNVFTSIGRSPGSHVRMDLEDGSVYFGGGRNRHSGSTFSGFSGCMKGMAINSRALPVQGSNDFAQTLHHQVTIGVCRGSSACVIQEAVCPVGTTCMDTLSGHLCSCTPGMDGKSCEGCGNSSMCSTGSLMVPSVTPSGSPMYIWIIVVAVLAALLIVTGISWVCFCKSRSQQLPPVNVGFAQLLSAGDMESSTRDSKKMPTPFPEVRFAPTQPLFREPPVELTQSECSIAFVPQRSLTNQKRTSFASREYSWDDFGLQLPRHGSFRRNLSSTSLDHLPLTTKLFVPRPAVQKPLAPKPGRPLIPNCVRLSKQSLSESEAENPTDMNAAASVADSDITADLISKPLAHLGLDEFRQRYSLTMPDGLDLDETSQLAYNTDDLDDEDDDGDDIASQLRRMEERLLGGKKPDQRHLH